METNGNQRYLLKKMYIILLNLRYHDESMKTNTEKLEVQRRTRKIRRDLYKYQNCGKRNYIVNNIVIRKNYTIVPKNLKLVWEIHLLQERSN